MGRPILFTADLHGNELQYQKLFAEALAKQARMIIIGGDLAPKDQTQRSVEGQRSFFENLLFPTIERFHADAQERGFSCAIVLIMGNDDFKANETLLRSAQERIGFRYLASEKTLIDGLPLLGYPYIPLTPFPWKDWEKLDLIDPAGETAARFFILSGFRSISKGFLEHVIDLEDRKETIEKDLEDISSGMDVTNAIIISHTPPYGTALDVIGSGEHVGSVALKRWIERTQPLLSLHGHIHETVRMSGSCVERIGRTLCLAAGNDNESDILMIVSIDPEAPERFTRYGV